MSTEFKVGDIVRLSARGKKEYPDHPANPHNLTGKIESILNVKWSNGKVNCYFNSELELVEPKQEQYYTSIPTDVKIGDKFEIIGFTRIDGSTYTGSSSNIGDIVSYHYNDGTASPAFLKEDENIAYLNWGWLKPVNEEYKVGDWVLLVDKDFKSHVSAMDKYKGTVQQIKRSPSKDHFQLEKCGIWSFHTSDFVKKVDGPVATAYLTDIQQFHVGDEVELIEDFNLAKRGSRGIILSINSSDASLTVQFKVKGYENTYIFQKRVKLINNKTDNNGKVHSTTTNDICTAFSPDIRSKEICTGQVFSEFNLPQIWSGH